MATENIVETWRQQLIEEGLKRVFEEKMKWVLEKDQKGAADSLLVLYEARFGAVPDDVRGVIEDSHHLATLHGWIQLIGIRSADEIIAELRAYRAR